MTIYEQDTLMGTIDAEVGGLHDNTGSGQARSKRLGGSMEIMLLMVPGVPARIDIEYSEHENATAMRDEKNNSMRLLIPHKYASHILSLRTGILSAYEQELWISVKEKACQDEQK